MSAQQAAIYCVAVLFALMGVGSIVAPTVTTRQFGIADLSRDGRGEVRAVYGGFGLAMAAMLVAAAMVPGLQMGVTLAVAAALGGMAAGRILSALMDRGLGRVPAAYLGLELAAGGVLLWASGLVGR